jgi:hypothetical protein
VNVIRIPFSSASIQHNMYMNIRAIMFFLHDGSYQSDVKKRAHICWDGSFAEACQLYSGWGCGQGDVVGMQRVSCPCLPHLNCANRLLLRRLQWPGPPRNELCTLIPSAVGRMFTSAKTCDRYWVHARPQYMSLSYQITFIICFRAL